MESILIKKITSILAFAALSVAGISVSPAMASEAPFVAESSTTDSGLFSTVESPVAGKFEVAAGHRSFMITQRYFVSSNFVASHLGQKLSLAVVVKDSDGNVITASNGSQAGVTYSVVKQGEVSGSGGTFSVDAATGELTLPASGNNYSGDLNAYVTLAGSDLDHAALIAAGLYSIEVTLSANGASAEADANITKDALVATYAVGSSPATVPANSTSASLTAQICLDSSKIVVGDVIKVEAWFDDVLVSSEASFKTRSSYADPTKQSYRAGGPPIAEITINKFDQTFGTAARTPRLSVTADSGTTHTFGFKLYNATTLADVSGTCAPGTPVAPVVSVVDGSILATGPLTFGAGSAGTICDFYDKAAPDVKVKAVYARSGVAGTATYSCTFTTGITGHTYFAKVSQRFQSAASALSPASADAVQPVRALATTPVPTIGGSVKVGQTLTANTGTWDANVAFAYQWFASGNAIAGATEKTFALTAAELAKTITVRVTGSLDGFESAAKTSAATAKVAAGTITVFATPKIVGTVSGGKTVSVVPGTWAAGAKLAYVWLLDGKAIKNAKAAKLAIAKTAKGHKLSVSVTATLTGFTALTKVSKVVKVG